MKNLYRLTVLSLLILISCEKSLETNEEAKLFQIENLHKDKVFQRVVVDFYEMFINTQDFDLLKKYLNDNRISENEYMNIHTVFGYQDQNQFLNEKRATEERIRLLNKRYDLKNRSNSLIKKEVELVFDDLGIYEIESSDMALSNCESIRRNCILSVASEASVMHIGCGLLDLTVVAGIACHGAAVVYQWSAGSNCNLEADNCKELLRKKVATNKKFSKISSY